MKPVAILVCDLGFGDAGKGSVVDALTRRYQAHTVVRFNGGCQAAHNVVLPNGMHHTFAQFGSGFFAGAKTYLSEFMLVEPLAFLNEANHLKSLGHKEPEKTVFVNQDAVVTTPFHIIANRIRETERGCNRIGSCGMGIGETMQDLLDGLYLTVGDLLDHKVLIEKLQVIRARKLQQFGIDFGLSLNEFLPKYGQFIKSVNVVSSEFFSDIAQNGVIIFEGAQGVLLDEWYGFHPYTTWSTTTFENAENVLKGYLGEIIKLGLTRSHMVRHGPGPFPTEDLSVKNQVIELHNKFGEWQRDVRLGWLDLPLLRYALDVVRGVDYLGLTHLDQVPTRNSQLRICSSYVDFKPSVPSFEKSNVGLLKQQEMTNKLFSVAPNYLDRKVKLTPARDLRIFLQDELNVQIGISSTGVAFTKKSYSQKFDENIRRN